MTTDTFTPGIHRDVPLADYRNWRAWSSSDLKAMRHGPPALVPWRRLHHEPDTEAKRIGTAAHCLILEPSKYASTYAHKEDGMSFATKEGKAWRDDPARKGKTILTWDEAQAVDAICNAFFRKGICKEAHDTADAIEVSVLWNDEATGLECKARPDILGDWLYDLKITHRAGQSFALHAWSMGWFHQAAHYRDGLKAVGLDVKGARLIAIDSEPPHYVHCFQIKVDALDLCTLDNAKTLKQIAECVAADEWPGTLDMWQHIDVPHYVAESAIDDAIIWPSSDNPKVDLHPITDR